MACAGDDYGCPNSDFFFFKQGICIVKSFTIYIVMSLKISIDF